MTRISLLITGLMAAAARRGALGRRRSGRHEARRNDRSRLHDHAQEGHRKVKTLKPGKYTITVRDKSACSQLPAQGAGPEQADHGSAFMGTKTVTVTLKKGKYTYQCDPHARSRA